MEENKQTALQAEEFVKKAHIISYLKAIGDNKENLLFFC